jgi:transcriptional regulator with XRE-family HTH domain
MAGEWWHQSPASTNRRATLDERRRDPIWAILAEQGRTYRWLARKTGLEVGTVRAIACGVRNATPEFRRRCADALDLPEWVLFGQCGASLEAAAS